MPDHPVILRSLNGFAAWPNTLVPAKAGSTGDSPAPTGGEIRKYAASEPTGLVLSRAVPLLDDAVLLPSPAQRNARPIMGSTDHGVRVLDLTDHGVRVLDRPESHSNDDMRYQSTASSYDRTAKAVTYRSDESEGPPTGQRPPTLSLNRAGLDAPPGKAHVTMRYCGW